MVKPLKIELDELPLDEKFESKGVYADKIATYQLDLLRMQRVLMESNHSVVLVFEGPDAAGKGGCIRRITEKLDPRTVRVYSVVKPTPEEYAHHYLWRFWNKLPKRGEICIFDRSWYGRVLVERVEKFAQEEEWQRAYSEINALEKMLTDDGTIIIKFYLHISKDEQLRRFRAREADPYKHWKINDEDWRNRRKWKLHNEAAEEMFRQTHTACAPWHVVGTNYKWFARTSVARTVVARLHEFFE